MTPAICIVRNCAAVAVPGIERCQHHERQRLYSREHQRRKRAAAKLAREVGRATCGYRLGRYVCGAALRAVVTDRMLGRVEMVCDACRRREHGICQDCPCPVYGTIGRALRCAEHARAAARDSSRASAERHIVKRRASARRYYRKDKARRERRNEYKRAWRKLNREKVRLQKRRAALRQGEPLPTYCATCGGPVLGEIPGHRLSYCDACIEPGDLRRREARRAEWRAEHEATPAQSPAKRRPPTKHPALRLETGERLCCGTGCTTVVVGRAKKCDECKERERQWAAQAIRQARAA